LSADQLFALLPAVYRTRDAENGGALQALFAVLAEQSAIVEDNIEQLYDDQFIETCAPWVIPYLGDLIGYNSIYEVVSAGFDSRAEVANTISYRRRKGTLLALEQLCMDVSGRPAVAVEEFKRLIVTESMRHVRPHHASTVNLRRASALDRFNTAFDVENRTIDVRRIAPRLRAGADPDAAPLEIALHGPGRFNIPDVAIHLWRWRSWPVGNAPAFSLGGGRYLFSPLGQDLPLFSQPPIRSSFSGLTTRIDVPQPISRQEFAGSLRPQPAKKPGECRSLADESPIFYGPSASILLVTDGVAVDRSQICCANLADRADGTWCSVPSGRIAIDPELGRIRFAADLPLPQSLRVNYSYGFPAEIAGGPYDRSASLQLADPAKTAFLAVIGSAAFPTLESAVAAWNGLRPGSSGILVLPNFEGFSIDLTGANAIRLPAGSNLTLASGKPIASGEPIAPGEPIASGGPTDVIWNNSCVTLTGTIEVNGVPGLPLSDGETPLAGQLLISGIWLAGQLIVSGQTAVVQISDSTLVPGITLSRAGDPVAPGDPSIVVTAAEAALSLTRSISGPIAADSGGTTRICASILDATSPCCVAYSASDLASAGADLHVEDSTIIGKVHTRTIPLASNTIFHARRARRDPWPAAVWASRRQSGCVRFCSLPFDFITPRRYLCLPPDSASQPALEPRFITLRYGKPSYALLSGDVPMAVWHGADNGSQIGVYGQIQETEAVRNVQLRAPEYLPVCLESGIFLHPSRPLLEMRRVAILYGSQPVRLCCDDPDAAQPSYIGIGSALM
ncbi:MAG TPA: hypothetical protein VGR96_01100, partial [Acidobacteriaceae bacterium]|nr:hypothetical protein [Acidobacteriaceae bacterium]